MNEFASRLRERGHRQGRYLFLGTVHSFCLGRVIRPYAHLIGREDLRDRTVLAAPGQLSLRQQALDAVGVQENPNYFDTTLRKIRRDLTCGDDLHSYDSHHVEVAKEYEKLLRKRQLIDFDAMTFEALRIIEHNPPIADLIVSRFPWIAVDEYQDLGGVLHRIIVTLRSAGANIFAVGDPDQCVYEFAGAKPATLQHLASDEDFRTIRLRYNYRSGRELIDAASVALDQIRDYEPDPDRIDLGEVLLLKCDNRLDAQAHAIVDHTVPALIEDDVALHEISILYPGRGPILDAVTAALEGSDIPYRMERQSSFPTDPIVRWLQQCAAFTQNRVSLTAGTLAELVSPFLLLVRDAGILDEHDELTMRARLGEALDETIGLHDRLDRWLEIFLDRLDLHALLHQAGRIDEQQTLEKLRLDLVDANSEPVELADFALNSVVENRIVVTTYHSSKGRQFDVVLLPGLQDTLVPRTRWNPTLGAS